MLLRRLSVTLASLLVALAAIVMPTATAVQAAAGDSAYLMAYFKESLNGSGNVNAVHLAVSTDGMEWTPLNDNKAILTPTAGTKGIRDPFVYRMNDGTWVVAATDIPVGGSFTAANPNIHIWTSPDLVNWSNDRLLKINGANPDAYTWAPSIYWDAGRSRYAITYSTVPAGFDHSVIMVGYTSDFLTVTAPVVLYDVGHDVIDSHLVTGVNGYNYLYYKDQATGRLVGARSASLDPGSFVKYTDGAGIVGCIEAPTLVQSLTSPSTWWLWGDSFCPNSIFYAWQGDPATGVWTAVDQKRYTAPQNAKHNGIATITQTNYDALINRYGTTSWNRLKSYNYPDRYVRHAGFMARIDPLPFEPYQDSQWRIVPGLADPKAVSLESVNYPGHYLRHQNFDIRLSADDGSANFRADATFTKIPGLADSGWSSFRSYNYPDRFIRHFNHQLFLQVINGSTAEQDATFHIGA